MGALVFIAGVLLLTSAFRGHPQALGSLILTDLTGNQADGKVPNYFVNSDREIGGITAVVIPVLLLGIAGFYTPVRGFTRAFTLLFFIAILFGTRQRGGQNLIDSAIRQIEDRPSARTQQDERRDETRTNLERFLDPQVVDWLIRNGIIGRQ